MGLFTTVSDESGLFISNFLSSMAKECLQSGFYESCKDEIFSKEVKENIEKLEFRLRGEWSYQDESLITYINLILHCELAIRYASELFYKSESSIENIILKIREDEQIAEGKQVSERMNVEEVVEKGKIFLSRIKSIFTSLNDAIANQIPCNTQVTIDVGLQFDNIKNIDKSKIIALYNEIEKKEDIFNHNYSSNSIIQKTDAIFTSFVFWSISNLFFSCNNYSLAYFYLFKSRDFLGAYCGMSMKTCQMPKSISMQRKGGISRAKLWDGQKEIVRVAWGDGRKWRFVKSKCANQVTKDNPDISYRSAEKWLKEIVDEQTASKRI